MRASRPAGRGATFAGASRRSDAHQEADCRVGRVRWPDGRGDFLEIRARVSGYLQSIHFDEGQVVKKGDLLFVTGLFMTPSLYVLLRWISAMRLGHTDETAQRNTNTP